MFKLRSAFTLSEVLLAMSVVSIVAAMTIPTLYYQRMKKEYSTKLKHFYSRMENAILDMELDKGSFRDMKHPGSNGYDWYMENVDPYMGHTYADPTEQRVYFKDGSVLQTFFDGGCLEVDLDVNGDKLPNESGRDRFRFLYCFSDESRETWFGNPEIFFGVYGSGLTGENVSRESMIEQCKDSATRPWCSRLLQNDQWEFKSDYPLRI